MGIGRKIIYGIIAFMILNIIIDYIVKTVDFTLQIWIWDLSGFLKTIFVGIINLIAGIVVALTTGIGGVGT